MTEGDLQRLFVPLVAQLITWAYAQGYQLTFGEAWRTPEQAAWNAAHGTGILHTLHLERLAVDFNLFKDGVWLTDPDDFRPLGEFWTSLHPDACWGGEFGDPGHFSLAFGGRK